MRTVFGLVGMACALLFVALCITGIRGGYEYQRTIGGYWNLSVKVSTLQAKGDYLDRFLAAVDSAKLSGHNAIIFPTPDNDVERNIAALRTLQARIHEAKTMDPNSMAYQQAMNQITAQEQDEATHILSEIEGRWWLDHHPRNWGWIGILLGFVLVGSAGVGIISAAMWNEF